MMSHSLCCFALLVYLNGRDVMLVKASNDTIRCGNDNCCQAMGKLMTAVNEINNKEEEAACPVLSEKIDKQAKDLEQMKGKLDRRLASMTKLITAVNEINKKQDELAANMNEIHGKQAKALDELKVNLNRSLASMSIISTQLEKHSADLLSHDERFKAHDVSQNNLYQLVQSIRNALSKPKDCSDIRERHNVSGVYRVYPGSDNGGIEVDVYCDFKSVGQSWLVFQRRKDGSVNFERSWTDYERGFGDLTAEFWLGNEKLSLLTMNRKYKLRIEMEDFEAQKRYAEYSVFSVKPATDKYRVTVGGYSGNAVDCMAAHNNMRFSTKDADNDIDGRDCGKVFRGAWWYSNCHTSNLNGVYFRGPHKSYGDGINWIHWHGRHYSLKTTEMKIAAVF